MSVNRQITLAAHPQGLPSLSDFRLVEAPIPEPGEGEVLVRNLCLSVDPYMRGRMSGVDSYAPALHLGDVMIGAGVARVVASNDERFAPGDIASGMFGWQDYAVAPATQMRKIDLARESLTAPLSVLGMPGMTAYFGLFEIARPQPGETVVISGAAGAVGSLVGQMARIHGCRTVGIAGSDEKVRYVVDDLGFDAAFNYKTVADYDAELGRLCPFGIDVYFDNVGGRITDAVIARINPQARIAVCGQISQYNNRQPEMGPRWLSQILTRQARVEGFLVFQFIDRYRNALRQIGEWLKEGKLKYREQIAEGLENAPQAFIGMLQGQNVGKQIVRISRE